MNRRGAFTLIEMLVAMTATSLILGAVGLAVHAAMRANHEIRRGLQHQYRLDRLADRLRADAHAAVSGRVEGPRAERLRLTMSDDRQVEYDFQQGRIQRVLRQGNQVAHRDHWPLPDHDTAAWSVGEGRFPLVSLRIGRLGGDPSNVAKAIPSDAGGPPTIRFHALIRFDRRFDQLVGDATESGGRENEAP